MKTLMSRAMAHLAEFDPRWNYYVDGHGLKADPMYSALYKAIKR